MLLHKTLPATSNLSETMRFSSFLIVVCLTTFATGSVLSQDLGLGLKVGIQKTDLWDDPDSDFTPIDRIAFGILFQHEITERWALQPELLYSKKGADLIDDSVFQNYDYFRFNLDYLEIPVMLVFKGAPDFTINPLIELGVVPALKLDSNVDSGTVEGGFTENDTDDSVENFDFGVAGGVGFELPFGGQRVQFGARYTLGVMNIVRGSSNSDSTPDPKRNRHLLFSIGTRF